MNGHRQSPATGTKTLAYARAGTCAPRACGRAYAKRKRSGHGGSGAGQRSGPAQPEPEEAEPEPDQQQPRSERQHPRHVRPVGGG